MWLAIFLAFEQEQWVGTIRHSLTVPETSATCLVQVRTTWSEEHQNYPIVSKNCFTWPGWELINKSQSSWDPKSSGTKEGLLSSPELQRAAPSKSLRVVALSEHFKLWSSRFPGLIYRDPSLLQDRPLPIEKIIWFEVSISLISKGIFNSYLYLCIFCVCVCLWTDSKHNILLLWLQ